MSFILDALKKSEEQRPKAVVPDLYTDHAPPPPRKARRLWPTLVILVLLVNAASLLWWLRPWERTPVVRDTTTTQLPTMSTKVVPLRPAAEPSPRSSGNQKTPAAMTVATPHPVKANLQTRPAPASAREISDEVPALAKQKDFGVTSRSKGGSIAEFKDLPSDLRREIPSFDISLHFYTAAPESRLVRINGRNLREGQQISDGLLLEKITASGVILHWRGQSFRAGNY